jgi:hypothetical protein
MTEEKVSTPTAEEYVASAPSVARRQFTATLTEDQYAYVKSLGRLGLSRLIQNIMAAEGLYLVEGKKPWYRWWR